MRVRNIKLRWIIPSIMVLVVGTALIFTRSTPLVLSFVGYMLGFSKELASVFWLASLVFCACYFLRTRKTDLAGKELFVHLMGPPVDLFFSALTYGLAFQTAIRMLDGIFGQLYQSRQFIIGISRPELFTIVVPMLFLLFWSITQVTRLARIAYFYSGPISRIMPGQACADATSKVNGA